LGKSVGSASLELLEQPHGGVVAQVVRRRGLLDATLCIPDDGLRVRDMDIIAALDRALNDRVGLAHQQQVLAWSVERKPGKDGEKHRQFGKLAIQLSSVVRRVWD